MKKFVVYGIMGGVWGAWEIITIPEMIEQRASERGITVTAFELG